MNEETIISKHGGYRNLLTYKRAEMIYDATVRFCEQFLNPRDRTVDQMVQAARSGKQNIVEGSVASGTSKETEIKLTNVARASLEELLEDYRDFLRSRTAEEWPKDHAHAKRMAQLLRDENYAKVRNAIEHDNPVTCAQALAALIKITTYLLAQQIKRLEQDFIKTGGLRERMTAARLKERRKRPED